MSVIRIAKDERKSYVVLDITALNDAQLSFRAKGLHSYLMSKPHDWQVYIEQLAQESPTEGRVALSAAMKELEQAGYVHRHLVRTENGQLRGTETIVYETPRRSSPAPKSGLPISAEPKSAEPKSAEPKSANLRLLKIDSTQDGKKLKIDDTYPLTPMNDLRTARTHQALRCPAAFVPSPAVYTWAAEKYPHVNVNDALEAMRDHEFQRPHTDWNATLRTWIRNTVTQFGRINPPPPGIPTQQQSGLSKAGYETALNLHRMQEERHHGIERTLPF